MSLPIQADEAMGFKIFNTRAAKATEKIAGKGYSAIEDEALKTLPAPPPGAVFDAEEQAKYRAFKEARRGAADYIAMEGEFAKYLQDVYSAAPVDREALTDECEILVVGAGFAGLLLWYKLRAAGLLDVRFCEKGGDVGGPWERTIWGEAAGRWTVFTDRGDKMRARYVVLANGILTTPKLARIEGMEAFAGKSFHTSRWDYTVDLEGKSVGIIGTGATAVQAIPEIAKVAKELY